MRRPRLRPRPRKRHAPGHAPRPKAEDDLSSRTKCHAADRAWPWGLSHARRRRVSDCCGLERYHQIRRLPPHPYTRTSRLATPSLDRWPLVRVALPTRRRTPPLTTAHNRLDPSARNSSVPRLHACWAESMRRAECIAHCAETPFPIDPTETPTRRGSRALCTPGFTEQQPWLFLLHAPTCATSFGTTTMDRPVLTVPVHALAHTTLLDLSGGRCALPPPQRSSSISPASSTAVTPRPRSPTSPASSR